MEALQKMVELKEALKRGEKAINDKTTVDRWFREWIEVYKKPSGITEKSLDMYMQKYNGYIKPVLGSLPLKDIKEIQLQKILNEEAGKSYSHVSKLRMVMRELFSKARKSRLIVYDPSEDSDSVCEGSNPSPAAKESDLKNCF